MEIYCTRPSCPHPLNLFTDLDDPTVLKRVSQKYCISCGMPLILADRYVPLRRLGQGGFGTAFLARDRYTPTIRQCVVKLFQPSGDLTPSQLQIAQTLFEREAEVLEVLGNQHPRIPDLYAFFSLTVPSLLLPGKQDQFFYLVQEFIDGQTLEQELTQKGTFSQAEVLEVLRDILPVLQFIHENGSIHRDIKPSNIMRDRKGRLYLLDFGAVKQVTKVSGSGSPSHGSTGIYSMGYAPPEQMAGGQVFPSTDLYALAVTCLMLLTGKQPAELYDVYNNQWNWKSYASVSVSLAQVLDRMLLPSPNQRFQSATEVLTAIAQRPRSGIASPQSLPSPPAGAISSLPKRAIPTPGVSSAPPIVSQPRFSLGQLLVAAAFTGFEGALLAIALTHIIPSPGVSIGLVGAIVGGLIYAQYIHLIEGVDLLIAVSITLGLMFWLKWWSPWIVSLNLGSPFIGVLAIAGLVASGAIAVTALFRLIYKLLSLIL